MAAYEIDLHLFDGEGGGAPAGGAEAPAGDQGAQPQEGQQQVPEAQPQRLSFEELLRDQEYRAEYEKRVKAQLDRRFKAQQQSLDRLEQLEPTIALIAERYRVDPANTAMLAQAIQDDESLYEDEAMEKGIPVDQLKRIKQLERQNQMLSRAAEQQQRQQEADRIYNEWMQQAAEAQRIYPQLDFDVETNNPDFVKMLKAGVDVKTAYEVAHKDELLGGAIQYAAQTVAKKVANDVRARGARPPENATGAMASSVVKKTNVSDLTAKEVIELAKRAKRGESISFA